MYETKSIKEVRLLKILYQQKPFDEVGLSMSNSEFERLIGFVCLVTFEDDTRNISVVNIDMMNRLYVDHLVIGDHDTF